MNELWRNKRTKKLVIVPEGWEAYASAGDDFTAIVMSFQFPSHTFEVNMHNYEKVPEPEAKELWGDRR